jgi:uncharacterized membrane protein
MNSAADRAVNTYLERLDADLADLPRARRREIVDEIEEHIAQARAELPTESEAETRSLLERLGDPADIAADARQRFGVVPARPGWMETAALVLLLFGGFVFGVGWIIGLVLLWSSTVWTPWEKLLGTLVLPGGLAFLPFFALYYGGGSGSSCTRVTDPKTGQTINDCTTYGSSGNDVRDFVLIFVLVAAPLMTTAYLAWRMRRRAELTTA